MLGSIHILLLFIVSAACAFQLQCHTPVVTNLSASIGKEEEKASLPSSPYGVIFDMDVSTVLHQFKISFRFTYICYTMYRLLTLDVYIMHRLYQYII